MKIGLLTHQFPGVRGGGIGTYILQAAAALHAIGQEVHIFALALPADVRSGVPQGVHLHEVKNLAERVEEGSLPGPLAAAIESGGEGVYRLALGWLLCQVAREFHRQHGLDIVEAPEYEALGLPLLLKPEAGLAVVTQVHLCSAIARAGNADEKSQADSQRAEAIAECGLIDALESAAILLADGVCAATQNIVTETKKFLGVTCPAEVIPYPMQLQPSSGELPEHGPVLFVGRLELRKGAGLMAPAFNRFLSRNPRAIIRLVGGDTQCKGQSVRATLESQLAGPIRERVQFLGEKSPAQVQAEFAACRFSIVPSLLENFAYSAAESLAAGRAVVVGDQTGAVEVVGDAGVVFPRGDPEGLAAGMEKLWRDSELCARLGRRARERATELFSRERTLAARLDFYQAAIAGSRSRAPVAGARLAALDGRHMAPLLNALALLTGTLAGVPEAGEHTPGRRLLRLLDQIDGGQKAQVLLYGAGRFTARLLAQRHLWESNGHRVTGLIDDHPRFSESAVHLGLPVCSGQWLQRRATAGEAILPIVLSTDTFEQQFWEKTSELRKLRVRVYRLPGESS